MQDFKKDIKQIKTNFKSSSFWLPRGQPSETQLAPNKVNPKGASAQLLISNTVMRFSQLPLGMHALSTL